MSSCNLFGIINLYHKMLFKQDHFNYQSQGIVFLNLNALKYGNFTPLNF